jgi:putative salt-induced outer membrane protein YdiY
MTRRSRNLERSPAWAALLVLAPLICQPGSVSAQETPQEAPAAAAEDAGDVPTSSQEALDEVQGEEAAAELITAPGGVPVAPTDAETAIAVKASMASAEQQAAMGAGGTYAIQFGDTFDWVRLASGEWIKGNLKRMRDDNVEFDSDKLEMLNIDFADVTHIHSPQVNTYVFDERVTATGKAVITPDTVIVQTEEGTKTFPRSELESIIEGGEREREWWWMKLRFGLTYNRGNTDQLTYDINFNTRREDRMTLLDLGYNATFGKTNGVQNVNRNLGELDFKVFLSSRWFVTPLFGQLLNDRFQNIRLRATPAAGAGVHIIDAPKVKWDFQTGFGYQYLKYKQDTAGVENPQQDAFIPLYTYADFDITGDVDLTLSWLTNLVVTGIGRTNHTGKADLSIELTDVIDLDLAFLYLRTEEPAPLPPSDPPSPPIEKNDYQLVVGISLELG